jgi:toxin ParE1/3/4
VPKELNITPRAQAEVDEEAAHYQATDSLETATRFLDELCQVFERLVAFPHLGTPWPTTRPELLGLRRRLLPHFPYSVFYLPTEHTIEIVRVLHNSRDLPARLEDLEL